METRIVKHFVPDSYQEEILKIFNSYTFPWFWNYSISGIVEFDKKKFQSQYGFAHNLYFKEYGGETSQFYSTFKPMTFFIEEKFGIKVNELLRMRMGLLTKVHPNRNIVHVPHIDYDFQHKTLLYYIDNSDGDTLLYDEVFDPKTKKEPKKFNLLQTITPKRGTAVLFDGLRYHSSSSPCQFLNRIVLNINFL